MVSLELQELLKHCFTELLIATLICLMKQCRNLFEGKPSIMHPKIWLESNSAQRSPKHKHPDGQFYLTNISSRLAAPISVHCLPPFEEILAKKYGGTFSYAYPYMFRYAYFFIFYGEPSSVRIHGRVLESFIKNTNGSLSIHVIAVS